ncbi:MAG: Ig-like domain-containing protein [bacterium]
MHRKQALIHPANNIFIVSLQGNSIYTLTTTTGQHKGAYPAPPPDAAFPLPYQENFESYAAGVTPKYTSDQKGTFETATRADGQGRCLQQIVPQEGIPWGDRGSFPNTVFGDSSWTDYTLQADVLGTAGRAGIGGRWSGYFYRGWNFSVQQNGTWAIEVPNRTNGQDVLTVLATGQAAGFNAAVWHHLAIGLKGSEFRASLDGQEVGRVQYAGYNGVLKGFPYLMSSYGTNCFDNVAVTVLGVSNAPVATAQSLSTAVNTAKAVTLAGSDAENSPLTFAIVTGPAQGVLSGTPPDVTYTPAAGYTGSDAATNL